ncbi:undecaprenyl-phosphate galactose phosphotransferase WbaP [Roseiconus nitratireducens]|uniref:Undecaprenyl-phosphate galactose phosphotransferase WbaP n=1 Tax=Roseiconus nitratireducens TaxID=2605748 RepID=A0A5M6CVN1_9BACT|nr:undecaprenyl-phosphate galactose phosphotransferase WbaP [Roseiconus nitratireducens]KAA5539294.1 undecaprenyl-phosphate galactose phosphotransferase WbaP [Roseiconus nitratireducens]
MSSDLQTRPLPVGVVSADAIEQLDPFVPAGPPIGVALEALESPSVPHRIREEADGPVTRAVPGSNHFQLFLTSMPLVLADVAMLLGSLLVAASVTSLSLGTILAPTLDNQMVAIVAGYLLFGVLHGLFPGTGTSPVVELRQCVLAVWASFCLMIALNLALGVLSAGECSIGVIGVMLSTFTVPLFRMVLRKSLAKTSWWGERALIIGAGPQGRALFRFYDRAKERGLRPIGLVDSDTSAEHSEHLDTGGLPYLGSINELDRLNRRYRIRWAIVAPGGCRKLDMGQVMANASKIPNLLILPSQYLLPSLWATTRECAGVMGVHLRDHLQNPIALASKRLIDIVLSLTALICLSPVLLLIIAWVKWKSPGPAFYGHTRIGRGGKMFKAWKFRSMVADADRVLEEYLEQDVEMRRQWIEDQKLKNDPRIIPGVGHILRKSSLDELPQLWNVLCGDMSLVGPRPIVNSEIERYREMYPLYLRVRPGITGLWQVSGRNDTSYEQRVRLDSYYVCNWSVWLDAYLVLRTVRTILMREGAY